MFFSFSKRKISVLTTTIPLIFGFAILTVQAGERFNVVPATVVYLRSARESLAYWWGNDFSRGSLASAIRYKDASEKARSIPVITYHGLPGESSESSPFSSQVFSEHMKALTEAGWTSLTLSEFEDYIRGRTTVPERSFLLTFDDGRKDTFYPADPVLKDLGLTAVMFAITKHSVSPDVEDSPYYLSPYELRAMEKSGRWDVQSHGRDSHDWYFISEAGAIGHFFSNLFWLSEENRIETEDEFRERVAYDLARSKSDLEAALGKEIKAFAYPFGDFGQDGLNYPGAESVVREELEKIYELSFYQARKGSSELFNYPSLNGTMMRRIEPLADWSGEDLVATLNAASAKELPYSASSFGREWQISWGDVALGDKLSLRAFPEATGAGAGLSGSWWWSDYDFSADVTWHSGTNVVLVARNTDEENYFGCNFGRGKVYIKTLTGGNSINLAEAEYNPPDYGTTARFSVSVDGERVVCAMDGQNIISAPGVNGRIVNGGIAIEVWDQRPGTANADFDNISVIEN